MKKIIISFILISLFIFTGCTNESSEDKEDGNNLESNEKYTSVEWADAVMWNDKKYYFDEEKSEFVMEKDIDQELGEINFTIIYSEEKDNPKYQLKNNEATILKEGSKLYSIIGEDSSRYIYSGGKVYREDK